MSIQVCQVCDKPAVYRFSPDLDIRGLGACKEHREDVGVGYMILLNSGEDEYKHYMKNLQKKEKRKHAST